MQTPKRRPVKRIALNLDRCRKFVELLERPVVDKVRSTHLSALRKGIGSIGTVPLLPNTQIPLHLAQCNLVFCPIVEFGVPTANGRLWNAP